MPDQLDYQYQITENPTFDMVKVQILHCLYIACIYLWYLPIPQQTSISVLPSSISLDYDQPQQNNTISETLSSYEREHVQHTAVWNPHMQPSSMEKEVLLFVGIKGTVMHDRSKLIKENVTKTRFPSLTRRNFNNRMA